MKLEDMSFGDYLKAEYEWKEKKGAGKNKPCKFAEMGADGWECSCFHTTECHDQKIDYNPDGKINLVMCGYKGREQNERA